MSQKTGNGPSCGAAKPVEYVTKSLLNNSTQTTATQTFPPFDMRKHEGRLTLDGGSQSPTSPSYLCPKCGADNFKIGRKTGAYSTFGCECATTDQGRRAIRDIVAPLERWEKSARPAQRRSWTYTNVENTPIIRVNRTDDGNGRRKIWQNPLVAGATPAELGTTVLPYRYEDCLNSIARGEAVFWGEGEATADALWEIGIPATTTIRGSDGYQSAQYRDLFPAEALVICPDRDVPGLKYANAIAADYPAANWLYAYPDSGIWDRLPEKGGADLADWIEAGATAEQILAAIEPRRMPVLTPPIVASTEDFAALRHDIAVQNALGTGAPAGQLLPTIAPAFEAIAEKLNVPAHAFTGVLLVTAAGQIPVGVTVEIDKSTNYRAPAILNVGIVADSGAVKSPIFSTVVKPLQALQAEAYEGYGADKKRYDALLDAYTAAPKNDKPDRPEPPGYRRHYVEDVTTEAIAKILHEQPGAAVSWLLDELAALINGADQYRGGRGSDRQKMLSFYNGSPLSVERKSGEPLFVNAANVSIAGTIQPSVLRAQIGADTEATDGFWARWVFVNLPTTVMPPPGDGPSFDIAPLLTTVYRNLNLFPADLTLRFSPEARRILREWHIETEKNKINEVAPLLRAAWPKRRDQAYRIALISHCIEAAANGRVTPTPEISAETLGAAIAFVSHAMEFERSLYSQFDATTDDPEAAQIAALITKFRGREVTHREIRAVLPKTKIGSAWVKANAAACREYLERLCSIGVAVPLTDDFGRVKFLDPQTPPMGPEMEIAETIDPVDPNLDPLDPSLDPSWVQPKPLVSESSSVLGPIGPKSLVENDHIDDWAVA
jgi:hypothetical protein